LRSGEALNAGCLGWQDRLPAIVLVGHCAGIWVAICDTPNRWIMRRESRLESKESNKSGEIANNVYRHGDEYRDIQASFVSATPHLFVMVEKKS
jgi:hypothetical protein